MVALVHAYAEVRAIPDGTGLRSLGVATFDLDARKVEHIRAGWPGRESLDRSLDAASALVVLVDGAPCAHLGQLHPFGLTSSELAIDAIAASARALRGPIAGEEPAWMKELVTSASLRARGVSMGSLVSRLALVLMRDERAWAAHVGDVSVSIARRAAGYELVELTEDHTLRRQMRESGMTTEAIDAVSMQGAPLDAILTRAFGHAMSAVPDVREVTVGEGDVLAPRSFVSEIMDVVPVERDTRLGDRRAWQRHWLDEGLRRGTRSPALLFAERAAS